MRSGEGYVSTSELYDVAQDMGFSPEQIDYALERAVSRGLIEGIEKGDADREAPSEYVRVTTTGGYYWRSLVGMFAYTDAVIVDTPVIDPEYREKLSFTDDIDARLVRVSHFVDYLDQQWVPLSGSNSVLEWPLIASEIRVDIEHIRGRSRPDRKHLY
jgi:hypothetical protein